MLIEDGRVSEIGIRKRQIAGPLPELDARGGWLLPALSDLHCHLCYDYPRKFRKPGDALVDLVAIGNAAAKLAAGVTQVRDLGGISQRNIALARRIDQGQVPGPKMQTAGDMIGAPGGHMHHYARPVRGPKEMRQAVRDQVLAGAKWVKLMVSGGVAITGERWEDVQLSDAELSVAVDEAHSLGARVAAHAHPKKAILSAVSNGCDTIEHATVIDEEVIDALLTRNTSVVPTLSVYDRIRKGGEGIDPTLRDAVENIWTIKVPKLRDAYTAGVRIGVGTDSGGSFPANDIATELRLLVTEVGIPPLKVIEMATQGNAAILGLSGSWGNVETGSVADLIVVDSDPLADISAISRVTAVVMAGNVVGMAS